MWGGLKYKNLYQHFYEEKLVKLLLKKGIESKRIPSAPQFTNTLKTLTFKQ
jgi:hypothetical protein